MPPRTGIHIEGDAADLLQELVKVIQKTKEHERELKKITGETKKLTKEEKELAQAAKRVYDDTRTPQERHIRKMEQLNRLVAKSKITQETYRRAVRQSQEQLTRAGQAGQKAFGAQALGQARSMIGSYVSMAAAIGAVVRVLSAAREERRQLAEESREMEFSAGALAQLTGGDAKKTARLQAAGLQIYGAGGAKTPEEAMEVAFNLQSAGALKERGFVSRLAAVAGREGIVGLTGEAGKLQKAFGEKETGDYVEIFSKATGAAAPLPKVGVSEILKATAKAAGSAGAMGLSDEELFAAVSRVSGPYNPDEASTAVARMLDQLSVKRPEMKGQGLVKIMEKLTSEQMTEAELKKLLQIRGVRAYRVLKDIGGLRETLATVEQAQRDEAILGVVKAAEESPKVWAGRQKRLEEAREWRGRQNEIEAEKLWQGQKAAMRRAARERGEPEWAIGTVERIAMVPEFFYTPEAMGRANIGQVLPAERAEWEAKWDKLDRVAESLARATENLEQSNRQQPVQTTN